MAHTLTYDGHEIAYDEKAVHKWSVQRAISGADGPVAMYDAIDRVLLGKTSEVADILGDDLDSMLEVLGRVTAIDRTAKN